MDNILDNQLKTFVKNSVSFSEVARKCGRVPVGAQLQWLRNRIIKLKLDTSHFLGRAARAGERQTGVCRKHLWHEVLVNSKSKIRVQAKKLHRAYSEYCNKKGIAYKCAVCNTEPIWNNMTLKFQLDHIDEQCGNNLPNNLRWICPNCHTQKNFSGV
jgi:hypothetical protein